MAGGTLVRELAAGALVDATFAVSRKERRTRRDGRPFLDLELTDKSGRVRARVWDGVPVLEQRFDVGDTVRVLGRVGEYAGRVELEVRDVERVEPGDPAEFVPGARRDIDDLDGYIDFLVLEIYHDGLRALCEAVLRPSPASASASAPRRPPRAATIPTPAASPSTPWRSPPSAARRAQLHPRLDADLLTGCGAAARLRLRRRVRERRGDPAERARRAARPRAPRPRAHRARRRARRASTQPGSSRCSARSPRTTARPRAGASRAPRRWRCMPPTRSTRASTTRSDDHTVVDPRRRRLSATMTLNIQVSRDQY